MVTMVQNSFASAAVIGTGMMGPGVALTLAFGGLPTTLLSRTPEGAAQGLAKARAQAQLLAANGLADAAAAQRAAALISVSTDFDATIRAADLVVESGPEDMAWKQDLFARMDALAGAVAVLASNTSGLSITAIAERCARPERVLTTVCGLLEGCGKTPVVVRKDRPGQLGNRLQMALLREAVNIIAEGIADAEAIDTVAKNGFGIRMPAYGILEHQDVVGLDLGLRVADYVAADLNNEPRAPEYFHELVRTGQLGAKTGRGFYDWSVKSADDVRARRDAFLIEVLRYRRKPD